MDQRLHRNHEGPQAHLSQHIEISSSFGVGADLLPLSGASNALSRSGSEAACRLCNDEKNDQATPTVQHKANKSSDIGPKSAHPTNIPCVQRSSAVLGACTDGARL